MTTRPATLADLDRIAPLFDAYRQFYEQPADLATATQFLHDRLTRGESQILLAEDGAGQAIGFCQLYPVFCSIAAQPIYLLSDLFVTPDARRSGAGRALLLAAERLSAEHGKLRMELTTARTNHTAQAAYAALGWERDEVYLTYTRQIGIPTEMVADTHSVTELKGLFGTPTCSVSIEEMNQDIVARGALGGR